MYYPSSPIFSTGDAELIARLKHRDPDAMGILFDRLGKPIFSLIVRVVKDKDVAEDLLAEVFVKIWNGIDSFPPGTIALDLWVLAIARNHSVDRLRCCTRGTNTLPAASVHTPEQWKLFSNLDISLIDTASMHRTARNFAGLQSDQQNLLESIYFEGKTPAELAASSHQPAAEVRSRIENSLRTIRFNAESGIGESDAS